MATSILKVPDIGDFHDVEIIEVLVKPGDTVAVEQSLITVESDKASMEIPATAAGTIVEMKVKLGDKVSQGSDIAVIEAAGEGAAAAPAAAGASSGAAAGTSAAGAAGAGSAAPASAGSGAAAAGASPAAAATAAGAASGATAAASAPAARPGPQPAPATDRKADIECDMLVIGGGPGGYSAAFRAADLGMKVVIVERYATLGGVCLNVGCIPSKALLHTVAVMEEAKAFAAHGIRFGAPEVDLDALRAYKDKVVARMTGGLGGMAKGRKVTIVRGYAKFLDPHHVVVDLTEGTGQQTTGNEQVVRFSQAIIAAGSEPVQLPFLPKDERIVDSTGALALKFVPKRMLVIGGGIIGLEMATVYASLGAQVDVVEMLDGVMAGADRDLVKVWQKHNEKRLGRLMVKTKTTAAEATPEGIRVSFEGEHAPAEPQVYDLVLSAVGRTPNGKKLAAENAGVAVGDRGFIDVDSQMRTNVPHIFAIGDIVGQPMLAHKAVHEAHVAAEAAAGQKRHFDARVIPAVAYTDPEVAWVGISEDEAKAKGVTLGKAVFPWMASGRAVANGRDEGFTKLLFDPETHRILGGSIVGTSAGDMIGELALAIEMGADAADIGHTIHPHPTLGESIGMAAEVFEGVCTDLPPQKKR
ncbi:dihydrolipoyl dehydrogenase [Lautropia dentalis]|uniref:Dihydrolipoyl dehydrogenase n=1 Tax=Lautropia dentalis TaxID=2490857 RepID=A0A426FRS2_9BURK|nr:dihydrolipoyl dehydrogenase [Lautropia dentalis]RRN45378.1 dihydrolipoyl dehydrogenase [Lautropia dentalis]